MLQFTGKDAGRLIEDLTLWLDENDKLSNGEN